MVAQPQALRGDRVEHLSTPAAWDAQRVKMNSYCKYGMYNFAIWDQLEVSSFKVLPQNRFVKSLKGASHCCGLEESVTASSGQSERYSNVNETPAEGRRPGDE
ncbi:hypothetical protein EVAR_62620_1 [Eumeta japonica]|uniref:Uncharacterized protein n=1 Tax=Eumeta variegata TaxID=151549 RepID=A0A4C1ZEQ8_EUMVA|nr:hypothetical protein EVAR_62620_1 [Eumeta japonica]